MEFPPYSQHCARCQLYTHDPGEAVVPVLRDTRPETRAGQWKKRVLFVYPRPHRADVEAGHLLAGDKLNWLSDFLEASEFEWAVTTLNRCWPGLKEDGKQRKPTADQQRACVNHLAATIAEFRPDVVVAMGAEVLKNLWPTDRGDAPSINKARVTPIQHRGRWLCAAYDPILHGIWLASGGQEQRDLTEEYIRTFELLHSICEGNYSAPVVEWRAVSALTELDDLGRRLDEAKCRRIYFDVEDNSWLGKRVRPHEADPERVLPEQLTIFHPDSRLLMVGVTAVIENWDSGGQPTYETYVILPSAWQGQIGRIALERVLRGSPLVRRTVEAWNTKYDVQCLWRHTGIDLADGHTVLGDGMLLRGLPNQSVPGNGLKPTAQELLSVPDWTIGVDNAVSEARAQKRRAGLPALVSLEDLVLDIVCEYNANDTYWNARLVETRLNSNMLDPGFPVRAYAALMDGLPYLCAMERNGLPVDAQAFAQEIETLVQREAQLLQRLRSVPEVRQAEAVSAREFNVRSPLFYEALCAIFHGRIDPVLGDDGNQTGWACSVDDWYPRTPSNKLSTTKEVFAQLSGSVLGKEVAWAQKTRAQRLWTLITEWKQAGDDLTRLRGLFDYVTPDSRIHTSFRILKADLGEDEALESGASGGGGTVSGRFATSPNTQNLWPRIKRVFRSRPGWVWAKFDYGRIELAWIGWTTGDPLFLQWTREGRDQHAERGAALWATKLGRPRHEFDTLDPGTQKVWRKKGKTQNFAAIYGEEPETTAAKTGVDVGEVIADLKTGDANHPKIREKRMQLFELCQAGQPIETYLLGRRRYALDWQRVSMSAEEWVSHDAETRRRRHTGNMRQYRSLWNTWTGQADASDMAFCMGAQIYKRLTGGDWLDPTRVIPVNFEHDCLVFEIKETYIGTAIPEIRAAMQDLSGLPRHFDLPIPVDAQYGETPLEVENEEDLATHPYALKKWRGDK